ADNNVRARPQIPVIPRREFRHQRYEFQVDKVDRFMVPVRPINLGGGVSPYDSAYDPTLRTAGSEPTPIFTKTLSAIQMERGVNHHWIVHGSSKITTPPSSLNSADSHIPCPGDVFVHFYDLERQIWIMMAGHNWQSVPADAGYVKSTSKKSLSSYVKHPDKDKNMYFRYEPGKDSRPKWIREESLKRAIRGLNAGEKQENAGTSTGGP
ncbi:hypothetical protein CYLTODRAFT_427678, partial [Cylindrobasidium torrendii FP15055 ss-10]